MDYEELREHLGERVNIVEGEYVLSPTGAFLITLHFSNEAVWLTTDGDVKCITSQPFVGRKYQIGKCIALVCEYLGGDILAFYNGINLKELMRLRDVSIIEWIRDDSRFKEVPLDDALIGDCLVYNYSEDAKGNHIGILHSEGKILHHLPGKLSCIDTFIPDKLLGVFRYYG